MRHLKTFVLSEGRKYQDLVPDVDLVSPNRSGKPNTCVGWAYCARTADENLFLVYFEKDCPRATLSGARPGAKYKAEWFNPHGPVGGRQNAERRRRGQDDLAGVSGRRRRVG